MKLLPLIVVLLCGCATHTRMYYPNGRIAADFAGDYTKINWSPNRLSADTMTHSTTTKAHYDGVVGVIDASGRFVGIAGMSAMGIRGVPRP